MIQNNMKSRPDPIQPFKVYKVEEAAQALQVDKSAIYKAIDNNELPKKDVGKGYRILGEHILQYMGSATFQPQQNTFINNAGVPTYQNKE